MASTYSPNLSIELIGTGDQAGTWGVTTNSNLGTLIEQAISGYVTQAVSTGSDTTITIPNGATGVARNMYIELTGTGGTNTNLIVPSNKKLYFIFNNSTGAVTVKVSGQTGVSVPQGKKMILVSNGTDIVNGVNYIADFGTNSFTVTNLTATSATITNLVATSANITTLSNNPVLNAGTANGVLYLNGSKVATSGSALVFDGSNLGIGTSSPSTWNTKLVVYGSQLTVTGSGYDGAYADSIYFGGNAEGTTYRNKISNSLSSTTTNQLMKFSVANGASTWADVLILNGAGNAGLGVTPIASTGRLQVQGENASTSLAGVPTVSFLDGNANDEYSILRFGTSANGSIAVIGAKATTTGAYPSSVGQLEFGVQNGASTTTVATMTASGNLGLGVVPSAWDATGAGGPVLQIKRGLLFGADSETRLIHNAYYSTGDFRYIATGVAATNYQQQSGQHRWYTAPSGTAGNAISFSQAMTLDASGNLLVGATSSAYTSSGRGVIEVNGSSQALYGFRTGGTARGYLLHEGTNLILSNDQASGYLSFQTVGTERARITADGNLGVGTTSPTFASGSGLEIQRESANATLRLERGTTGDSSLEVRAESSQTAVWTTSNTPMLFGTNNTERARFTSGGDMEFKNSGGTSVSFIGVSSTAAQFGNRQNDAMILYTNNTERARITAGGNLLVGTTATPSASVEGFCATGTSSGNITSSGSSTSAYNHWVFYNGNGLVGSISTSGSATSYNVSSDRRLKENIAPSDDAGSVIDAIAVVKHDWKVGGHTRYGMVAQDLYQVAPEAVTPGDDGEEVVNTWGVDYSKLVPMLIKEVQSLRKRVAELEKQ